jgi:hypothetical protein
LLVCLHGGALASQEAVESLDVVVVRLSLHLAISSRIRAERRA